MYGMKNNTERAPRCYKLQSASSRLNGRMFKTHAITIDAGRAHKHATRKNDFLFNQSHDYVQMIVFTINHQNMIRRCYDIGEYGTAGTTYRIEPCGGGLAVWLSGPIKVDY